jgi:hypothetical protein
MAFAASFQVVILLTMVFGFTDYVYVYTDRTRIESSSGSGKISDSCSSSSADGGEPRDPLMDLETCALVESSAAKDSKIASDRSLVDEEIRPSNKSNHADNHNPSSSMSVSMSPVGEEEGIALTSFNKSTDI